MAIETRPCPTCGEPVECRGDDADTPLWARDDRCATCRAVMGTREEERKSFEWAAKEFRGRLRIAK